MKKIFTAFILIVSYVLLSSITTIANWNFEDQNPTLDNGITANHGKVISTSSTGSIDINSPGANLTTRSISNSGWNNGNGTKYWEINIVTTGYNNLKLTSYQRSSETGPRNFKLQYSFNDTNWSDVPGATITNADNFTEGVLNNISLPNECNNKTILYLRWIMTSNTNVNLETVAFDGTSRIDEILITGDLLPTAPTVTVTAPTTYSYATATLIGNITATSGDNCSARGFKYTTDSGFSTGITTITQSDGNYSTGEFNESLTGLTAGTTYYVKAFATNSAGTTETTATSFTTLTYPAITFTDGSTYTAPTCTSTSNDQPIGRFSLTADKTGATLSSLTVDLNLTSTSGASNVKLWKSTDDTFSSVTDTNIKTVESLTEEVTFSDINSAVASGETYYFITLDLTNATGSINPQATALSVTTADVTGFTNPSELSSSDTQTLPVELSSFTAVPSAVNQSITLNWTTQSETDMLGYYVYSNSDNQFNTASRKSNIITANNSSTETNYSWTDSNLLAGQYYYWLKAIDRDGSSQILGPVTATVQANDPTTPTVPVKTAFNSIYPNPFNPTTSLVYSLATADNVKITIYNIKGEVVKIYNQMNQSTGNHSIVWNGTDFNSKPCSSGVYFFKMDSGKYTQTKKALLVK